MKLHASRIVIVIGSSGIGLATARAAADEGAEVVIVSSRQGSIMSQLDGNVTGHTSTKLSIDRRFTITSSAANQAPCQSLRTVETMVPPTANGNIRARVPIAIYSLAAWRHSRLS